MFRGIFINGNPLVGTKIVDLVVIIPPLSHATFCLDAKGTAKKSRLYKSLAKNQCVGRSKTKLAALRQWFPTDRPSQ